MGSSSGKIIAAQDDTEFADVLHICIFGMTQTYVVEHKD